MTAEITRSPRRARDPAGGTGGRRRSSLTPPPPPTGSAMLIWHGGTPQPWARRPAAASRRHCDR